MLYFRRFCFINRDQPSLISTPSATGEVFCFTRIPLDPLFIQSLRSCVELSLRYSLLENVALPIYVLLWTGGVA